MAEGGLAGAGVWFSGVREKSGVELGLDKIFAESKLQQNNPGFNLTAITCQNLAITTYKTVASVRIRIRENYIVIWPLPGDQAIAVIVIHAGWNADDF